MKTGKGLENIRWSDCSSVSYEDLLEILARYFGQMTKEISEELFYMKPEAMQKAVNWYEENYGRI